MTRKVDSRTAKLYYECLHQSDKHHFCMPHINIFLLVQNLLIQKYETSSQIWTIILPAIQ